MSVIDARFAYLAHRRSEIIEQVGDEATFRDRGERYLLSEEDLAMYDELRMLDYLTHNE